MFIINRYPLAQLLCQASQSPLVHIAHISPVQSKWGKMGTVVLFLRGIGEVVKWKEKRECGVLFLFKSNTILLWCLRNYPWNKTLRLTEILSSFPPYWKVAVSSSSIELLGKSYFRTTDSNASTRTCAHGWLHWSFLKKFAYTSPLSISKGYIHYYIKH